MGIDVVELHHHSIRVDATPGNAEKALAFYTQTLGLQVDPQRPNIPNLPGYWLNVGPIGQIHIMALDGAWKSASGPDKDPTVSHVALAVSNIDEAIAELDRTGVAYWIEGVTGNKQVFMKDPANNLVELHQVDKCRCAARQRHAR
jgi:catechol 2,3-dioxygenase-like lactoylglutathione lyase family enzyme